MFRESFNISGAIPKVVSKLEDDDSDVRAAAVAALQAFTTHGWSLSELQYLCLTFTAELYYSDIKSTIPTIIRQLDHESWATRFEVVRRLTTLSELGRTATQQNLPFLYVFVDVFQETIKDNGATVKLITKLKDDDDGVRAKAVEALLALATKRSSSNLCNFFFSNLFV